MERIGFVGLGVMGKPMAANLARSGRAVTVFARRRDRAMSLELLGASVADSLRALGAHSDVVITIVSDSAAVKEVIFGPQGLLPALKPGSVLIDMSTISAQAAAEFARRLESAGCSMLDAPVSGGEQGAIAGTLGIMVGGRRDVFEKCLPLFQVLGKTIIYAGPSGNGQKTKLVNQLVGATTLLATVEGLRLAEAAGLNPQATLEAVGAGAAASWMWVNAGPKIVAKDFSPGFRIRLQHKDLKLLQEMIQSVGGDFPAARLVYDLYSKAMERGLAEHGNHGLAELWQQEAPVSERSQR